MAAPLGRRALSLASRLRGSQNERVTPNAEIVIRPMRESDVAAADRIFRLAFGTFLRMPDPMKFAGDSQWIAPRFRAEPSGAFVAERDGAVVGSVLTVRWGTVGLFGPLTVEPDLWDQGIARRLLEPVMERFDAWGTTLAGLFTFADSAKHVALYGKFGFYPRFLTALMSRPAGNPGAPVDWTTASAAPAEWRERARELGGALWPGLDVTDEMASLHAHGIGDGVLVHDGRRLAGIAVCHVGPGSEAMGGTCYVKFGAVRPGPDAAADFDRLLAACDAFAAARGAKAVVAGTNLARKAAYRRMIVRGFRTEIQGVAMHRANEPGYSRPDAWALDDWR